jgi:hypothetical protein
MKSSESRATVEIDANLIDWVKALIFRRFIELELLDDQHRVDVGWSLLLMADEWIRLHLGFRLKSLDFLTQLR